MRRNTELIFITVPSISHLVPFVEFGKRLINQDDRIRITIVVMKALTPPGKSNLDAYVESIASSQKFIRFIDVPELEEKEKPTFGTQTVEAYAVELIERSIPLLRNIVMSIVSDGVTTVKGLVCDLFCLPMIDIANDVNLPVYLFLTTNSGFLAMMKYLEDRNSKDSSVFVRDSEEMLSIPGFANPVPVNILPSSLFIQDGYDSFVKLAILLGKANGVIVNSSIDIDSFCMNHQRVYAVGPLFNLKPIPPPDEELDRADKLMKWLDDQHVASVVFVCFGSMGRLRGPLVKEIANGLELCQYRFIWSVQTDDVLPEGFLNRVSGRGMVCSWSPQVDILAHNAVGGFVSHCGWNSIIESLWFGVPIVTWPMYAEQQLNAFLMVKELKLAVELKLDYWLHSDEIVTGEEIETAIRCIMKEEGNDVRKRVMEVSQMARKATLNGGSSYLAIENFIQEVIGIES